MTLAELCAGVPGATITGDAGCEIAGLRYDSRAVEPGDLFMCFRGFVHDGHDFIPEALGRGARALMVDRPERVPPGVPAVVVPDTRRAAGPVASRFYGDPSARLHLVGVTGTNGKTTTTFLIRAVLSLRGPVGLVGTVHNVVGGEVRPVRHTTPEAVDLQSLLHAMAARGDHAAVMEVSSHALALHRVDGCRFDIGVFTNLTQDHLDFHGDLEGYREAKARLFEMLGEEAGGGKGWPRAAVINADDPSGREMARRCRVPVITYGLAGGADVSARDIRLRLDGAAFRVVHPGGETPVELRLTGQFNVYNALAAFAVGLVEGFEPAAIAAALAGVPGVPGRFELVPGRQEFAVIVDYAHTPDGLENVLRAVRELSRGKVITVFGCGGDRDRGKRPLMGQVAARLSDMVIITSDNPRSEEPAAIAREIEAGVRQVPGRPFLSILSREAAIRQAIAAAGPGDVVLIAGKGHERYQIFRDSVVPFDDRQVASQALQEMGLR